MLLTKKLIYFVKFAWLTGSVAKIYSKQFEVFKKTKHSQLMIDDGTHITCVVKSNARFSNSMFNYNNQKYVITVNNDRSWILNSENYKTCEEINSKIRNKIIHDITVTMSLKGHCYCINNSIISEESDLISNKEIVVFNQIRAEKYFNQKINSHTRRNQHLLESDLKFKNAIKQLFNTAKKQELFKFFNEKHIPVNEEIIESLNELQYLNELKDFNVLEIEKHIAKLYFKKNFFDEMFLDKE